MALPRPSSVTNEHGDGCESGDALSPMLESRYKHANRLRNPPQISGLLRSEGTPRGTLLVARPAERPYPAVHQCRHEPVQGHLPRTGKTRLPAGHDVAEMR